MQARAPRRKRQNKLHCVRHDIVRVYTSTLLYLSARPAYHRTYGAVAAKPDSNQLARLCVLAQSRVCGCWRVLWP